MAKIRVRPNPMSMPTAHMLIITLITTTRALAAARTGGVRQRRLDGDVTAGSGSELWVVSPLSFVFDKPSSVSCERSFVTGRSILNLVTLFWGLTCVRFYATSFDTGIQFDPA